MLRDRPSLHNDLETFCDINLLTRGSAIYAERAVPLLLALKYEDDKTIVVDYHKNFNSGMDDFGDFDNDYAPSPPDMFIEAVKDNWYFIAHNWSFEYDNYLSYHRRFGWPLPKVEQFICTAAKARYWGLSGTLEKAGQMLNLPIQKDKEGSRLIKKFCIPQKRGKGKHATTVIRSINPNDTDWAWFKRYNRDDVETEYGIDINLPDIPAKFARYFHSDAAMNVRGFPVDIPSVQKAVKYYDFFHKRLEKRFKELSGGLAPSQVAKVKELLNDEHHTDLDNLQSATLRDMLLEDDFFSPEAKEMVEIRAETAKASIKKLAAFLNRTAADGRAHGGFMWFGAHTGRRCLTGDHEVLTRKGWVRLDEWNSGDIAVWNPSEEISFQRAIPNEYDFCGNLYGIKTNRIDQLSTGEHKMPGWSAHHGGFQIKEVHALGRFCLPYTGVKSSGSALDNDQLRVIVMTQADAHYSVEGSIKYKFVKERKVERCIMLLRRCGIVFDLKRQNSGATLIQVRRRHVPLFLRMFETKIFGYWLLEVNHDVLFEEIELWDGSRAGPNSTQYTTTNRTNAEIIQTCAHVSGRAAIITLRNPVEKWADTYNVSIWFNASNRHEIREKPYTQFDFGKVYCPTTSTGFFMVRRNGKVWVTGNSGKGVQPQNFPRGTKPALKQLKSFWKLIDDWVDGLDDNEALELADILFGKPLDVMAAALRGFIKAKAGKRLLIVDYSQIELRVMAWLAGEEELLALLRSGVDPYINFAAKYMYGVDPASLDKESLERQIAKSALLGAQYQIWITAFIEYAKTSAGLKLTLEEGTNAVVSYRNAHPNIVDFWKDIEKAAIFAVESRGTATLNNLRLKFEIHNSREWLRIYLPSGRPISYFEPKVSLRVTEHERTDIEGNPILISVTNKETGEVTQVPDTYTKRKTVLSFLTEWKSKITREYTYGGKLAENAVQGCSADIMYEGEIKATEAGYDLIASVHDETVTEVDENFGSIEELIRVVCDLPDCYDGLPIAAEGFASVRYRK